MSSLFPSYLSFLRSPIGTGLTEIRGNVEMEPCDWLLANEEVSRLSGDCGGVMRLGLLHSECEREPGFRGRIKQNTGEFRFLRCTSYMKVHFWKTH